MRIKTKRKRDVIGIARDAMRRALARNAYAFEPTDNVEALLIRQSFDVETLVSDIYGDDIKILCGLTLERED